MNRNRNVLAASAAIVFVAVGFASYLLTKENASAPSFGDWGDYVGGFGVLVTLVWLVAGHMENQREIRKNKRDLEEQMELTREIAGALTRIASGTQAQAAEVLVNAQPAFVCLSAGGTPIRRGQGAAIPVSGTFQFRNDGGAVLLAGVDSLTNGVSATLHRPGFCGSGDTFSIVVEAPKPLREVGMITLRLRFEDKFKRAGWAAIIAPSFDVVADIQIHMGEPG